MEVTRHKILICLLLIKIIRNFKVIELPLNIVQLNLYLAKNVFIHNGTQLEGEKCKFQKLQNKDHPIVQLAQHNSFMLQYVKASVWLTLVALSTPGAIFNNAP